MKLDDLLYHLHHPDALDQLDHQTLASLIRQYPYLESLKSAYYKKYPGHTIVHHDLNEKLSGLVQAGFSEGQDDLLPPVFDLDLETIRTSPDIDIEPSRLVEQLPSATDLEVSIHRDQEESEHRPIYSYSESGFIAYLKSLPSCRVPKLSVHGPELKEENIRPIPVHHPEIPSTPIQQTEELIKSSLDLRDNIGTESLANLWATQGKPELAIQIYEKLLAENPEKSSIFAAKIEKLKAEYSL